MSMSIFFSSFIFAKYLKINAFVYWLQCFSAPYSRLKLSNSWLHMDWLLQILNIACIFSQIQMFSVITSHCHARRLPHRLWKLQLRPCCQLNSCHNSNLRQHVSVCWTLWLYYDFNNSDAALIFEYECYLHHRSLDHRRRKLCMCQYHCPHLKRKCICPLLCCYRSISKKVVTNLFLLLHLHSICILSDKFPNF